MSNYIFVIDTNFQPLNPIHPARARKLLKAGKAAIYRKYPFTLVLKKAVEPKEIKQCQLKLDPGSKTTGIVLLQKNKLIWAAELTHRGQRIKNALESRRSFRRGRRNRKTRYRQPRFLNRKRSDGWIAPSLKHRVLTTMTWVKRLIKRCPIKFIAVELVRFDTQKLQQPEIEGAQYQQGTLYQYEVKEYLLEKWSRTCAYCDAKNVPLEVEHIVPKSRGGSNRVSNLTLACVPCNQAKSNRDIKDFLADKPDLLSKILKQVLAPLKVRNAPPGKLLSSTQENLADAAAVNSTRWKLFEALKTTNLPVTTGTGGQTKFNRTQQNLPKTHWLDAANVGETPQLKILTSQPLLITAKGHGIRQRAITDKYGFSKRHRGRFKLSHGFKTGDIVKANIPKGKYAGHYNGLRIAIRTKPTFALSPQNGGKQFDAHCKYLINIHKADGYSYSY
ncbi:RNA-guided endonuclease IscB [Myxosarcina sp. GI1]|uniref:RNA-guided endonuclease IscB n=1 Tax=Myxosarcina sp. GI1 TaxID=1541065 RepID=UPI0005659322|nr:RNA-guided endonuclease IscB [Myxosarcina sp. GI1]